MTCIVDDRAVGVMTSADPAAFFALSVAYEPHSAAAGEASGESVIARLGTFAKAAARFAYTLAILRISRGRRHARRSPPPPAAPLHPRGGS